MVTRQVTKAKTVAKKPPSKKKAVPKKLTKKIVKAINKKIDKDNADFESQTPAQKRVTIAKDVLKYIESAKLTPTSSTWIVRAEPLVLPKAVQARDKYGDSETSDVIHDSMNSSRQVCNILKGIKTCNACALGGLFYGAVRRADKLTVGDCANEYGGVDIGFEEIEKYLKQFFSKEQLQFIEMAFEGGTGGISSDECKDEEKAERVGNTFRDQDEDSHNYDRDFRPEWKEPKDRMRAIMQNIADNNGTFRYDRIKNIVPTPTPTPVTSKSTRSSARV